MFQVTGAFAEFERAMIYSSTLGLKRAKDCGTNLGRPKGRTSADPKKIAAAQKLLADGMGILKVAKMVGLGTGTVQRLKHPIR